MKKFLKITLRPCYFLQQRKGQMMHISWALISLQIRAELLQKHAWKIAEVYPAILHQRYFFKIIIC